MSAASIIEIIVFALLLIASTPLLGNYMAKVYGGKRAPGDRFFLPVERTVFRFCRIDPESEQTWRAYALSLLVFSVVGILLTYVILRVQAILPLNPDHMANVTPGLAFNTAVSFGTNTNWQNYGGESTLSQLSQMFGLVWHQFLSAAVAMAIGVAFIRALVRRRQTTLGNFWVDTVRSVTRILLPISLVFACVFMSQGVIQNFHAEKSVATVASQATHDSSLQQKVPGGPVASMLSIETLGDNGGGYFNTNGSYPYQGPNVIVTLLSVWLLTMIPFAFPWTFGKMVGSMRQGMVVLSAMVVLFALSVAVVVPLENRGNPNLGKLGVSQAITATSPGGNLEGKDLRLGATSSALTAAATTATSTGFTDSAHESYTPLGGAVPLFNMMLGEVDPGGTGSGLYGMLILLLITVFIAGLMVGRTPEYLGKKLQAPDMKIAAVYILILPATVLIFASISVLLHGPVSNMLSSGPHGLTEVIYAFMSTAHNNGSAFAGLSGNNPYWNTTLAFSMLIGRFLTMIAALALAGSLVRKPVYAVTAGTLRTDSPLFAGMVMIVVVVLVGLTYFPALALGPIVEHLAGHYGL
jgi:K+-transporting ATPase ATPase A chain